MRQTRQFTNLVLICLWEILGGDCYMNDLGVIGLGKAGNAFTHNLLSRKYAVSGYDKSKKAVVEIDKIGYKTYDGFFNLKDFVNSLTKPRKIVLFLGQGDPTNQMIDKLIPLLDKKDIICDGGNSSYLFSLANEKKLREKGIYFYCLGFSGSLKNIKNGPCILVSGNRGIYQEFLKSIIENIAAKYKNRICCTFVGENATAHYINIVHNGVQHAEMQLIAEIFLILKQAGYNNATIASTFKEWNSTSLKSNILEAVSKILVEKDQKTKKYLIDIIEDVAEYSDEGRWPSLFAIENMSNASLIIFGYLSKIVSNLKRERNFLNTVNKKEININIASLYNSYYLCKVLVYIQAINLVRIANYKYNWNLNLLDIINTFRSGSILQNEIIPQILNCYIDEKISDLLLTGWFKNILENNYKDLKEVAINTNMSELPTPIIQASLTYFNQLKSTNLGAGVVQAQRSYFNGFSYHRIDKPGVFNKDWDEEN